MAAEDQKINSADETMVSELLQELSDCREDERQMENQTIAVISTAGAVLGAILTANFLTETKCADIIRISFVLSNIIFCTAFAYVITLGIAGVMRYHYVRDIEDRLHRLVPAENAEDPDDAFVHWFSYRGALVSRNVKHVGGLNGKMYFVCYTVATVGASLFCVGTTLCLFGMLDSKKLVDRLLLAVPLLMALITLATFIVSSVRAGKESELFLKMARERRKQRAEEKERADDDRTKRTAAWCTPRLLLYLLYPKTKDPQKPFLIAVGYALWTLYQSAPGAFWSTLRSGLPRLLAVMFIFDVLLYPARYQANDCLGLKQDAESGKTPIPGILEGSEEKIEKILRVDILTAVLKVVLGLTLTGVFCQRTQTVWLWGCVAVLAGITAAYEKFRSGWVPVWNRSEPDKPQKKARWNLFWIMFAVGFGYPLRFAVGALATGMPWKSGTFLFSMLALYCYGIFVALVPWKSSVAQKTDYFEKKHYNNPKLHFNALYEMQRTKKWFGCVEWIVAIASTVCIVLGFVWSGAEHAGYYSILLGVFVWLSYLVVAASFPVGKIEFLEKMRRTPLALQKWVKEKFGSRISTIKNYATEVYAACRKAEGYTSTDFKDKP